MENTTPAEETPPAEETQDPGVIDSIIIRTPGDREIRVGSHTAYNSVVAVVYDLMQKLNDDYKILDEMHESKMDSEEAETVAGRVFAAESIMDAVQSELGETGREVPDLWPAINILVSQAAIEVPDPDDPEREELTDAQQSELAARQMAFGYASGLLRSKEDRRPDRRGPLPVKPDSEESQPQTEQ